MSILVKSRWVIKKWNHYFLVKDSRAKKYFLPGWTQEEWEFVTDCFYREIYEELWVKPVKWKLLKVREYINMHGNSSIEFWFEILNIDDFENICEDSCSHGHEWTECGFYDLSKIDESILKPNNLKEILENKEKIELLWIN